MNAETYGEKLFKSYLQSQNVMFEQEPSLPGITQLVDFVVDHPTHGKILLEVKDIVRPFNLGFGAFDPYAPIRQEIDSAKDKFKATRDYVCALVIVANPGSLVSLETPEIVLGAMYGDFGFRVPFNPERGNLDKAEVTSGFIPGRGKMVRKSENRNTRIAAVITVHEYHLWHLAMRRYLDTEDGRTRNERLSDIGNGTADLPPEDATELGVTVWENGTAAKRLPTDLFRGPMDAWWAANENGQQKLAFIGEKRRSLRMD